MHQLWIQLLQLNLLLCNGIEDLHEDCTRLKQTMLVRHAIVRFIIDSPSAVPEINIFSNGAANVFEFTVIVYMLCSL